MIVYVFSTLGPTTADGKPKIPIPKAKTTVKGRGKQLEREAIVQFKKPLVANPPQRTQAFGTVRRGKAAIPRTKDVDTPVTHVILSNEENQKDGKSVVPKPQEILADKVRKQLL